MKCDSHLVCRRSSGRAKQSFNAASHTDLVRLIVFIIIHWDDEYVRSLSLKNRGREALAVRVSVTCEHVEVFGLVQYMSCNNIFQGKSCDATKCSHAT